MELEDIPAVMEVERQSFTMPWPAHAYRRELKDNRLARYIVARRTGPPAETEATVQSAERSPANPSRPMGWKGLFGRVMSALAGSVEQHSPADARSRKVVGYGGLWLMVDEAHITAIGVAPAYRGLGIGELLLLGLIDIARDMGAHYLTLEVRVSNAVAQNLYRKYRFKDAGVRRRYYTDNNEDALIMWSDPLASPEFRQTVEQHRRTLLERLRSPGTLAALRTREAAT